MGFSPRPPILQHRFRARLLAVGQSYVGVVRSPSYFPLWLGQLISNFGDTLHYIALVILVFQLTGQGVAVAALVAAEVVPVLLLGPVAGVIIDRFDRKHVLIVSDLVRALLVLSLIWTQNVWHVYIVAAGLAAGNTFFNPTVQAVIPVLTTEEQRLAANSVSWSTGRLVQIIASAVAGGLIAFAGLDIVFLVNAATFVVSAAFIARLIIPPHAGQLGANTKRGLRDYFSDARAGLRFAVRDRFVSRLLLVQSLASFAVGATGAMLVVLSERHLGLSPAGFGWLIGAIGVGALLGPLIPNTFATDYRDASVVHSDVLSFVQESLASGRMSFASSWTSGASSSITSMACRPYRHRPGGSWASVTPRWGNRAIVRRTVNPPIP